MHVKYVVWNIAGPTVSVFVPPSHRPWGQRIRTCPRRADRVLRRLAPCGRRSGAGPDYGGREGVRLGPLPGRRWAGRHGQPVRPQEAEPGHGAGQGHPGERRRGAGTAGRSPATGGRAALREPGSFGPRGPRAPGAEVTPGLRPRRRPLLARRRAPAPRRPRPAPPGRRPVCAAASGRRPGDGTAARRGPVPAPRAGGLERPRPWSPEPRGL